MPISINVGLSKKLGMPDFGSVGATCSVTFEADHALLEHDLDGFHQRVKNAFAACHQAVQDQLAREVNAEASSTGAPDNQSHTEASAQSDQTLPTQPQDGGNGGNWHPATEKQTTYLRQLAKQVDGLGVRRLESLAQKLYSKPVAGLAGFEASRMIKTIKAIQDGEIDLAAVLSGAPE